MKEKKISISYLRSHLKSILEKVEKGESIIVEAHGRSIAEIKPLEDKQKLARQKLLEIGKKSKIGDILSPINEKWNISL